MYGNLFSRYGYMTNTKIKFVIVIEETNIPLRENDIRTVGSYILGLPCTHFHLNVDSDSKM